MRDDEKEISIYGILNLVFSFQIDFFKEYKDNKHRD